MSATPRWINNAPKAEGSNPLERRGRRRRRCFSRCWRRRCGQWRRRSRRGHRCRCGGHSRRRIGRRWRGRRCWGRRLGRRRGLRPGRRRCWCRSGRCGRRRRRGGRRTTAATAVIPPLPPPPPNPPLPGVSRGPRLRGVPGVTDVSVGVRLGVPVAVGVSVEVERFTSSASPSDSWNQTLVAAAVVPVDTTSERRESRGSSGTSSFPQPMCASALSEGTVLNLIRYSEPDSRNTTVVVKSRHRAVRYPGRHGSERVRPLGR